MCTSNISTLKLTRKLHRATSNVITLRENLRLHISSTERFQKYIGKDNLQPLPLDGYQDTLIERTEDILQDLHHHWDTSNVILNQFKGPMSLVSANSYLKATHIAHQLNSTPGCQCRDSGTESGRGPPQSAGTRFSAIIVCGCQSNYELYRIILIS